MTLGSYPDASCSQVLIWTWFSFLGPHRQRLALAACVPGRLEPKYWTLRLHRGSLHTYVCSRTCSTEIECRMCLHAFRGSSLVFRWPHSLGRAERKTRSVPAHNSDRTVLCMNGCVVVVQRRPGATRNISKNTRGGRCTRLSYVS